MGGGDQPHVNVHRSGASQPFEFSFLHSAQQFWLEFEVDVADLAQK